MGIFDALSGESGRDAAIWGAALQQGNEAAGMTAIGQQQAAGLGAYQTAYQQARPQLKQGYGAGIGTVSGQYPVAQGYLQGGVTDANALLAQQLAAQRGDITQGYGQAVNTLGGISATFNPWSAAGGQAQTMLGNAAGLGGPAGALAAQGAFQSGPGYQWQVNQAMDQVARQAAAQGGGGRITGNLATALQDRASNLANQSWGQWLSQLGSLGQTGLSATGQQAAAQQAVAQAQQQQGAALAQTGNIYGQQAQNVNQLGQQLGSLATSYGGNLANLQIQRGQQLGSLAEQYGGQVAGMWNTTTPETLNLQQGTTAAETNLGTQGMMAGQQASANMLNFGMGALGTAAAIGGMGLGGGTTIAGALGKGLGSLGSGIASSAGGGGSWFS